LLPLVARSDGWRRYGGGVLRVSVDELVWLRNGALREDQQMRQDVAKRIQEMGRSRAYRQWQNRPDKLADAAVSDDESRRPGDVLSVNGKGGWGRRWRALHRHRLGSKRAGIKAGFNAERDYCTGVTPT
jgi:hypothetical protein